MTTTIAKAEPEVLSEVDREAFERAIATVRARAGNAEREQLDEQLAAQPFTRVGRSCAYRCQVTSLKLKPWQWPVCEVEPYHTDEPGREHAGAGRAAALLRRMLDLGISRWEPDPRAAIARAEELARDRAEAARAVDGADQRPAPRRPRRHDPVAASDPTGVS